MGSPPLHEDVQRYLKLNHSPPRPRSPLSILSSHSSFHLAVKPAGSAFRTHRGSSVHSARLPSRHSWSGPPRLMDLPTSPSTATLVEFKDPGMTNPSSLQHQVKAPVKTTGSRLWLTGPLCLSSPSFCSSCPVDTPQVLSNAASPTWLDAPHVSGLQSTLRKLSLARDIKYQLPSTHGSR